MGLKYLTTFKLTNEREEKAIGEVLDSLSSLCDTTRELYNRTPTLVKATALVGLGILGTVAYQKVRQSAEPAQKIWVSYYHGGTGDAKDRPYDWRGFVNAKEFERINANEYIEIKNV